VREIPCALFIIKMLKEKTYGGKRATQN